MSECSCVACQFCEGTGYVYFNAITGEYLGAHCYDDLYEIKPCEECEGGVVETCDYCYEQMYEEDYHD